VLYEMLTGKRAFDGEDVSETLASVLRSEPDWRAVPPSISPTQQLVLRRCLEKDRRARIPDMAAVKFLIDQRLPDQAAESPAPARFVQRTTLLAASGVVLAALAAVAGWRLKPSPDPPRPQPVSFAFSPSEGPISTPSPVRDLAISPGGDLIVYEAGATPTTTRLYARKLDDLESRLLTQAGVSATAPFFSPDGQWVGFIEPSQRELRKVPIGGGPSTRICTYEGVFYSAAWLRDGRVVFGSGPNGGALFVVSAQGGQPQQLTKQPLGQPQVRYRFPSSLPDDRNILVSISTGAPAGSTGSNRVAVLNLETHAEKTVIEDATQAEYVDGGFLVYVSQGALRAKRFDPATLTAQGDSAVVVDRLVTKAATGVFDFNVSRNGNLIYVRGAGVVNVQRALTWVDRSGTETPIRAPLKPYAYARLSPEGDRIALDVRDENTDIWVWDIARETLSPLTRTPELDTSPIWTRDSRRIIFGSTRGGGPARLFWQPADGSGPAEPLATSNVNQVPSSLSPDGTFLVFTQQGQHGVDAMMLRLQADRRVEPLVQTDASAQNAVLSPNMKWVAFQSNEAGRDEIYVRPFPEVNTSRSLISNGGGTRPLWDPHGKELFYLDAEGFLTSVFIRETPQFKAEKPTRLFQTRYYGGGLGMNARTYDISQDGKRFLMIKEIGGAPSPQNASSIVVLANSIEALRAKLTPADQRRP
jgi:serine/threonine-protein kinase